MTGSLAATQIDAYERDGFLFPLDAMTADEALALRHRLERTERDYAAGNHGKPLAHYLSGGGSHAVCPLASDLCRHPVIADAAESLLGPDLMAWGVSFFIKEADDGGVVTWHQDLMYWGFGETTDQVTAWVALTPSTVENGCMRFVAGSHRRRFVPHRDTWAENNMLSRGQEIAVDVDDDEATEIVLEPGQFSLHHGMLFHSSGPNTSHDRRIGIAIRYVNPNARQVDGSTEHALLVRGMDRRQNFIHFAPPRHGFGPSEIALHEEIMRSKTSANY